MSPSSKTAFVLVPGSFSSWDFYKRVISLLTSPPHSVPPDLIRGITLPSTDHDRPGGPATMYDDAAHVAQAVESFADQGFDVVVAMNSYGGFVGTEAVKDLSKASRAPEGKQGGVVALVYLAAFLPTIGQTVKGMTGGMPGDDPYMDLGPMRSTEFAQGVFQDVSSDEALELYDQMTKHSRASFDSPLTYEGYKDRDIKVFYMQMKRDYVLKTEWQVDWIEKARASGVNIEVDVVDGGHVPMIAHEKEVTDLLLRAASA